MKVEFELKRVIILHILLFKSNNTINNDSKPELNPH